MTPRFLYAFAAAVGMLGSAAAVGAPAPVAPTLRHAAYVAIEAPRGSEVRCQAACVQHGYRPYQHWLKWRLVRPDGFVAEAGRIRPGEQAVIAHKADWAGRCVLEPVVHDFLTPGASACWRRPW